jgi:hypothetical protein
MAVPAVLRLGPFPECRRGGRPCPRDFRLGSPSNSSRFGRKRTAQSATIPVRGLPRPKPEKNG